MFKKHYQDAESLDPLARLRVNHLLALAEKIIGEVEFTLDEEIPVGTSVIAMTGDEVPEWKQGVVVENRDDEEYKVAFGDGSCFTVDEVIRGGELGDELVDLAWAKKNDRADAASGSIDIAKSGEALILMTPHGELSLTPMLSSERGPSSLSGPAVLKVPKNMTTWGSIWDDVRAMAKYAGSFDVLNGAEHVGVLTREGGSWRLFARGRKADLGPEHLFAMGMTLRWRAA